MSVLVQLNMGKYYCYTTAILSAVQILCPCEDILSGRHFMVEDLVRNQN